MCFGNARADNVMEGLALLQFGVYERATIPPPVVPQAPPISQTSLMLLPPV